MTDRRTLLVPFFVSMVACGTSDPAENPQTTPDVDATAGADGATKPDATSGADGATGTDASLDASTRADAPSGGVRPTTSPFGIATSASSSRSPGSWVPDIAATGITWVRGFDSAQIDAKFATFTANKMNVTGIFFFSGSTTSATFPSNDIPGWTAYVTDMVTRCKGQIGYWEVWNEPPNFTDDKTPESYAKIVATGYDAAKAADASVQIGLAAQSVNLNWLEQAITAGAAGHYDYVTVHPYETLGLVADGWEAQYMSIVPTIHKMLSAKDPPRANAPVWFTEIGEPVDGAITPEMQTDTLVKAYVMGIAQGVTHVHWFEGRDGDSGPFGLIDAQGQKRSSYTAMAKVLSHLGALPGYDGWVLLNGKSYGFVFEGEKAPALVAWAPPGLTEAVAFGQPVDVVVPGTGVTSSASSYTLTSSPTIFVGVPEAMVALARASNGKPFPWNGDHSTATSISYSAPDDAKGLHPLGALKVVTIDGTQARDCSQSGATSFTVDPNFLSYASASIRITAEVRRNGTANAGFNVKYESTTGWKGTGGWYTVPGSDTWYTQSWTVSDSEFVGKWGYHFSFDSDSTQFSNYSIRSVTVTKL